MKKSFTEQGTWIAGWVLLIFTGLSLSSCKTAHMALPQSLQSEGRPLAVEGRQFNLKGSFNFGPYHVNDVHRGWTRTDSFSIAEFSSSKAKQKYEFSVVELDRSTWDVQCATGVDWSQVELKGFLGSGLKIERSPDRQLVCSLDRQGGDGPSKLVMAQSNADPTLQGVLTHGADQINISATNKLSGSPFPLKDATGYLFHMEGQLIGAVEVINKGVVWLDDSVTPGIRSALAAASSVLLLYQDIKK